jgi:hypothetical protein
VWYVDTTSGAAETTLVEEIGESKPQNATTTTMIFFLEELNF